MRSAFLLSATLVFCLNHAAIAQNPAAEEARKQLHDRINQPTSPGAKLPARNPTPTVVTITYLTKDREWTASDGRKLTGRLVAFSAPKAGEQGTVEVIKDGKIRLRPAGSKVSSDIALEKLAIQDQTFVKTLQIRFSPPTHQ